jgi:hypothetical protein
MTLKVNLDEFGRFFGNVLGGLRRRMSSGRWMISGVYRYGTLVLLSVQSTMDLDERDSQRDSLSRSLALSLSLPR